MVGQKFMGRCDVKTALYVGKGHLFNRLIRWVQKRKGLKYWQISHCEIILKDLGGGFYLCGSASAMDGGVRMKVLALHTPNWQIVGDVGGEDDALEWLKVHNGAKYDWLGDLHTVFKWVPNPKKRWFCSEVCAELLGVGGAPMPAELTQLLDSAQN